MPVLKLYSCLKTLFPQTADLVYRIQTTMQNKLHTFHQQVNHTRFRNQTQGHYESFFLRANHPTRPLAFWIRYTIFSPKNMPAKSMGELWAIFFNGETNRHTAVKQEYPLTDCFFDPSGFNVHIGTATLSSHSFHGSRIKGAHWAGN